MWDFKAMLRMDKHATKKEREERVNSVIENVRSIFQNYYAIIFI